MMTDFDQEHLEADDNDELFEKLRVSSKVTIQELPELMERVLNDVYQSCKDFVESVSTDIKKRPVSKSEEKWLKNTLAKCWGLMAIDPHHAPFAILLDSALKCASPPSSLAKLRGDAHLYEGEDTLMRANTLIEDALANTGPNVASGVLVVEACHLFLLNKNEGIKSTPDKRWLCDVINSATELSGWTFPGEEWLSCKHFLALYRAREKFGWAFLGYELISLVSKVLLAFCWHKPPPIDNKKWRKICIQLLASRIAGLRADDPDRIKTLDGLPRKILKKLISKEERRKLKKCEVEVVTECASEGEGKRETEETNSREKNGKIGDEDKDNDPRLGKMVQKEQSTLARDLLAIAQDVSKVSKVLNIPFCYVLLVLNCENMCV